MTTSQQHDVVDDIITDHREFETIFTAIENSDDRQHRRDLVDHVIAELVRHSVGEEQYLYPVARRVLDNGDEEVDHELKEHAEAEKIMKEIEKADDDAKFDELVGKLIEDIRHHIEDEEKDLLPNLREKCSHDELLELGEKFEKAKKSAPTRPHPSAPDHPPANKILDRGAGLIDKMRDALTGRDV
ncbi:hemerythrin domain-containing protein [Mycobacterium deserti]|uniref:Hemerythrin domain-containing protein n=1 Tax=Mycobacterium deserti TaxID=2978347 RepID=A0ABT2M7T9_9MYCO|nr:hemerythrin domain-containing protein [Mycobacterium deserti]MCT7658322.1 hemerythrin domain-containing protein [Mycobacterium deserti]